MDLLVSGLREKAFSFSLFSVTLVVGFSYLVLSCGGMFCLNPICGVIMNGCYIMSNAFSVSLEVIWFLVFPLNVMYYIDLLLNSNTFYSRINHLIMVIFFNVLVNSVCYNFVQRLFFVFFFLYLCSSDMLTYSFLLRFFCDVFVWFWYQANTGITEYIWIFSFLFYICGIV